MGAMGKRGFDNRRSAVSTGAYARLLQHGFGHGRNTGPAKVAGGRVR